MEQQRETTQIFGVWGLLVPPIASSVVGYTHHFGGSCTELCVIGVTNASVCIDTPFGTDNGAFSSYP